MNHTTEISRFPVRTRAWMSHSCAAAALVALHLFVPGCAYEALSDEEARRLERDPDAEIDVQASAIKNGFMEYAHRGVVEIRPWGDPLNGCTGALVNDRNVLTAAHCIDDFMDALVDDELTLDIFYFDPDTQSKNLISRRKLRGAILAGWGCFHASSSCIDYQDDIAILSHDEPWIGAEPGHPSWYTQLTTADYLRISAGSLNNVTDISLYGRGYVTDGGAGAGVLRRLPIGIEVKDDHYFYSLAYRRAVCRGDSGGPYIGTVNNRRVIVGVQSSAVLDNHCATYGEKQYAARTSSREDWIKLRLGPHNCEDGPEYYRCF